MGIFCDLIGLMAFFDEFRIKIALQLLLQLLKIIHAYLLRLGQV
jgi:hypothetical protein